MRVSASGVGGVPSVPRGRRVPGTAAVSHGPRRLEGVNRADRAFMAKLVRALRSRPPPVRSHLVGRLKRQIKQGTYHPDAEKTATALVAWLSRR